MVKRVVDTDFWTSRQVIDTYSVEDKFFALYLMTNGRTTQAGIYSLPKKVMSFESGFTTDVIQVLIDRFSDKYGEIVYSEKTQEVTILRSLSYTILKGGKPVSDLIERELRAVEDGILILETYKAMQEFWESSPRIFDRTIQALFEAELITRELILPQNENDNQNEKQNDNVNDNVNDNHNDNEESLGTNRSLKQTPNRKPNQDTNRSMIIDTEEEQIAIEQYIKYLKHKKPALDQIILTEDVLCVFYKELLGEVTLEVQEKFKAWEIKLPKSIILEALVRSEGKFKPISYAGTIIDNWLNKGVKSTRDIARLDREYNLENS